MNFSKSKNLVIALLVFLSIYQTAKLWFEDFSGYNFFYFLNSREEDIAREDKDMHMLSRIIVNLGNKKFVAYDGDDKPSIDEALTLAISSGKLAGVKALDYNELLKNKSLILEYDYILSLSPERNLLNKIKNSNTQNIKAFNTIIIIPESDLAGRLRVMFVSEEESTVCELELRNNISFAIQHIVDEAQMRGTDLYYESSALNGFDLFEYNVFMEQWQQDSYDFAGIERVNPYIENQNLRLNLIEKHIDIFFDNPGGKWKSQVNEIYTYSDDTTVVKYYPMGVLEYSKYGISYNPTPDSSAPVYGEYLSAISFLDKDSAIINEYYLKDFIQRNGDTVFYFDYKINGLPIVMSDDTKEETGMDSIIEVVVSGGEVIKYKRYIYDFKESVEMAYAAVNYLSAIDKIFASGDIIDKNSVRAMYLGYNTDNYDGCELSWFVKTGEKAFVVEATEPQRIYYELE